MTIPKLTIKRAGVATFVLCAFLFVLRMRADVLMAELKINERRHVAEYQRSLSYVESLKKDSVATTDDEDDREANEIELNAAIQSARFHKRQAAYCSEKIRTLNKSVLGIGW
jgi:hypothetical protein